MRRRPVPGHACEAAAALPGHLHACFSRELDQSCISRGGEGPAAIQDHIRTARADRHPVSTCSARASRSAVFAASSCCCSLGSPAAAPPPPLLPPPAPPAPPPPPAGRVESGQSGACQPGWGLAVPASGAPTAYTQLALAQCAAASKPPHTCWLCQHAFGQLFTCLWRCRPWPVPCGG